MTERERTLRRVKVFAGVIGVAAGVFLEDLPSEVRSFVLHHAKINHRTPSEEMSNAIEDFAKGALEQMSPSERRRLPRVS